MNRKTIISISIILCSATIVYLNLVYAGFLTLDDKDILSGLRSSEYSLSSLLSGGGAYFRPLPFLSFSLNLKLFGGSPLSFHLINFLIHLANGLLIYLLAHSIYSHLPRVERAAFVSALTFVLTPLNTEAVMWMAGRYDLLCGFFFILALNVAVNEQIPRVRAAILLGITLLLSLLSKEAAISFSLILPVYLFVQRNKFDRTRSVAFGLSTVTITVLYLFMRTGFKTALDPGVGKVIGATVSLSSMVYESCAGFGFYLKKLVIPFPLNFAIVSINQPVYCVVFVVVLIGAIYLFARCKDCRLPLLIIFIGLLPPILALHGRLPWTPYAERYLYLPMVGMALLVGRLAIEICGSAHTMLVGLLLLLGIPTMQRVVVWADPMTFWRDVVAKSPQFPRGYVGVAIEDIEIGKYHEAESLLRRALSMGLERDFVWQNLAAIYLARLDMPRYEYAMNKTAELSQNPAKVYQAFVRTMIHHAKCFPDMRSLNRRVAGYYLKAYERDHTYIDGLYSAGKLYMQLGDNSEALRCFRLFLKQHGDTMYKPFAVKLIAKIDHTAMTTGATP